MSSSVACRSSPSRRSAAWAVRANIEGLLDGEVELAVDVGHLRLEP
jgi:hypothetical protein